MHPSEPADTRSIAKTIPAGALAGDAARISKNEVLSMGRGILLWLLGVPLPVILLLAMCSHR